MHIPDRAFWIGSDHAFDLQETYLNFRRDIEFPSVPQRASLTITADSRYRLWINGTYVCRGPARCWPHAQQMDELDIAAFLKPGLNSIAVQIYSPGYSHFAYVHRGACGLLAWLNCDDETVLVTDQTWRVQRDPSWDPLVPRVSIYGGGVERRNLNHDRNWQSEALDGTAWKAPRIVSMPNGPIWSGLKPRDVPMLIEEKMPLQRPWQVRRGHADFSQRDPHLLMRTVFSGSKSVADTTMPVKLQAGECAIWVFDLGSSKIGAGGFEVEGAAGEETLLISYAEKLRDGELVLSDPSSYCRMRPTDIFTMRPGSQTGETFSQRGGRYLIFVLMTSKAVTLELKFFGRFTRYPIVEKLKPIANPLLAGIAKMCGTTVVNCLQDGFVDSVWRESSQWLGDCVTESFALTALTDDPRPLRRAITMAAEGAYEDGILPSVLPGEVHAYTITDYNFSWIELLALYQKHQGARDQQELVSALLPVMDRLLARLRLDRGSDGLLISEPGRRLFLDWSGVDRREPNLTYNARYLHALQLAASIAASFDDYAALAERSRIGAQALAHAITHAFYEPSGWCENLSGIPASQLALSFALLTGLIAGDEKTKVADTIIARSLDLDDMTDGTGKLVIASPFMHHYVFQALEECGKTDAILSIIRARWGRWAAAGETTTWENWNVDFPDGSRCHGFSAHPLGWIARLSN